MSQEGEGGESGGNGQAAIRSQNCLERLCDNKQQTRDADVVTMTSEDTFEGYTKKLARKLSVRLHVRPSSCSKQKIPPPQRVKSDDKDKEGDTNVDPSTITALSTALLADYRYDMSYRRRGRAVLINIAHFEAGSDMPKRLNTGIDVDGLGRALEQLEFRVQLFEDMTCEQTKRLLHLLSEEDHSDADCLLVAVMTHGDDGEIYASDGPMPIREITAPFRGNSCRSLIGKPKIFLFQACRGELVDQGVAMDRHDVDDTDAQIGYETARTIPIEADFLMAYSSPEGYASWRNATTGAWFIQSLVQALEAYGSSWEFTRILTLVSRMVALQYESLSENTFMARKKQMPCFVSTLTKELYFRPKGNPQSPRNKHKHAEVN